MRIAAGVVGILGSAATLLTGVVVLFGATLTIGVRHGSSAQPDARSAEQFRQGGVLIVVAAVALSFSVVLLCRRLTRASSVVIGLLGLVGVIAQAWIAAVLILAGVLGIASRCRPGAATT